MSGAKEVGDRSPWSPKVQVTGRSADDEGADDVTDDDADAYPEHREVRGAHGLELLPIAFLVAQL